MSNIHMQLSLKKEIFILRYQFLFSRINSIRLALDRIEDAINFVSEELTRARYWNQLQEQSITVKLFLYLEGTQRDLYDNLILNANDYINFSPFKAEWIISSPESLAGFESNSQLSLKRWEEIKQIFNIELNYCTSFAIQVSNIINEITEKLKSHILNTNIEKQEQHNNKKKNKTDYENVASLYIKTCEKFKLNSPTIENLSKNCNNKPSSSSWDRYLKNPIVLNLIRNKVEKKMKHSQLSPEKKDLLFNIFINISDKLEQNEERYFTGKTVSLDERIDYLKDKFNDDCLNE